MRPSPDNVSDILNTLETGVGLAADTTVIGKKEAVPPGDVFLMGYSKGSPDILHFLAAHPEMKDRVRGVISWAGAVGGSYTPDGIYENIKDLQIDKVTETLETFLKMISPSVVIEGKLRRLNEYDIKGAILGLTTYKSQAFMEKNGEKIDALNIPIFNFTGATTAREVPNFQIADTIRLNKYDANNDMQLTQSQAKVHLPMATDLAMLHGHHWDLSYDPFPRAHRMGSPNLDHPFPKKAAVVAIFKFLAELGLID